MKWIKGFHIVKAFKIALAAVLSILTANLLGLKYAVTAGIITVLSIQNTKRETLKTARNRGLAFFVCAGDGFFVLHPAGVSCQRVYHLSLFLCAAVSQCRLG